MKLTDAQLAFVTRVASKFNEKSSVYAYAMVLASAFASKYQGDFAVAAQLISAGAGIVLFFLSDAQVRAWLTGQKPVTPYTVTTPPPKEG